MKTPACRAGGNRATGSCTFGPAASGRGTAFTLVELLVVIAVIGILAAMLLPVLARGKTKALNVACLNNLRQLEICWQLYALDNDDILPPNNFVYDIISDTPIDQGSSWCTNLAPYEVDPGPIEYGVLYQYNASLGIYHCPADKSTLQTRDGTVLPDPRLRSYNMSQSINGYPEYDPLMAYDIPSFKRMSDIRSPNSEQLIVFLDVHEDEITDDLFGIPTVGTWYYQSYWYDIPANRHDQGCNFSFADGHAEHWRWETPKAVTVPRGSMQPVTSDELGDYLRLENGFRQSRRN